MRLNAVLRKTLLLRKRFYEELDEEPFPIQYSHPEWLWKRWKKEFGEEATIALGEWNNEPAANFVRINPLKPSEINFSAENLEPTDDPRFYKVSEGLPHELLKNGNLYVQDLATRHAVDLVKAQPGEIILDACAAPGGKAAFIASTMEGKGEVVCTDSNEKRLPRLNENLKRLGVTNATVATHDWTQPAPKEWHGKFDAILSDVPCSNTGVIRRRVDVKWRLKPEQFAELVELQKSILNNLIPCLKEGGRLIYSTCSIDSEENEGIINWITESSSLINKQQVRITPHEHQTDGAFAVLLGK